MDVTVTRNLENSCAFESYVWDKLKTVLADCSNVKETTKSRCYKRKLRQGNCHRGDDGFNEIHIIKRSDAQAALEESVKNAKDA
eukprot:11079288-Ditylum_brightwellii.AAC.1